MNRTKNCYILKDLLFSGKKNKPLVLSESTGRPVISAYLEGDEPNEPQNLHFFRCFVGFCCVVAGLSCEKAYSSHLHSCDLKLGAPVNEGVLLVSPSGIFPQ